MQLSTCNSQPVSEEPPSLPATLSRYLSPTLWAQLQAEPTRRGLLLDALNNLHTLIHQLATYLPRPLIEALKRDPTPGRVAGERLEGALLFADVSGFTALSERLAAQGQAGVEALTAHINAYFEAMIRILARSDGALLKFAGDALLAFFPVQDEGRHALWAARAAQRMMRAMDAFAALETPAGPVTLQMKIGLSTGPFLAAAVGAPERMEYAILGDAVARTLVVEGALVAGQIGMDAATAALLPSENCRPHTGDVFTLVSTAADDLDDFEIRPERQRRARESSFLMASQAELLASIAGALRQLETMRAFLSASLVEALVAYAHQRQIPAENRPVAVLFLNITGPESLWDTADPATLPLAVRAFDACFAAIQQSVARYGGVISRIDPYKAGSKVLILFGAPLAREDDPLRAARAALDVRAHTAWDSAPGLALRGGIAYGPTFAGPVGAAIRREYTVMGDDVNLAARLMAAAQPGQFLVAPAIAAAIETAVTLTPLAPLQLKGKRDPVPVAQLEGLHLDPLMRRLETRGPLFGRDAELERARAALRLARAGQGQRLTILGGAGMGKSHLVDALAAEACATGFSVHLSACAPYTTATPYAPWTNLLRTLAGLAPDAGGEDAARCFLQWLAARRSGADENVLLQLLDLPTIAAPAAFRQLAAPQAASARAGIFQRLGQQTALPAAAASKPSLWQLARERQHTAGGETWQRLERRIAERTQARLFAAVESLLAALIAEAPRVLVFENVQWMDAASRQLLARVAETFSAQPLLLVATARPTENDPPAPGATLALEPLSLEATRRLTTHLLDDAVPVAELPALAQAIHAQTGGNPLFIEELCAWLRRTGRRDLLEGLRRSAPLQELVLSRLDALPHPEREVARAAAVVGSDFQTSDLRPLLEGRMAVQLDATLEGLRSARFMLPVTASLHYAFRQTLVRELLYDAQPVARRRKLHGRLARALHERYAADPLPVAELLAYHYRLAEAPLEAARYTLIAGIKAQRHAAHETAGECYRAVVEALEPLSAAQTAAPEIYALRGRAREGQGDLALLQGHFADAGRAYAEAGDDLPDASHLLARRALVLPLMGDAVGALEAARQAWTLIAPDDETASVVAALLAWLHGREDANAARAWAARSRVAPVAAYFAGELHAAWDAYLAAGEPLGAALVALQLAEVAAQGVAPEVPAAAHRWLAQAMDIWAQENDAWGLALVHACRETLARQQGDEAAAAAAQREAVALLAHVRQTADVGAVMPADGAAWRQRYTDIFHAVYLFNLLTVPLPEVQ